MSKLYNLLNEMIAEVESNSRNKELISRVKLLDKNINAFGSKLHSFIDAYDIGCSAIFWSPEQVVLRAKGKKIAITKKQSISILKEVIKSHKPNKGVSWDDIDKHLQTYSDNRFALENNHSN